MVPCRVAGVAVGGRDLNWERISMKKSLPIKKCFEEMFMNEEWYGRNGHVNE